MEQAATFSGLRNQISGSGMKPLKFPIGRLRARSVARLAQARRKVHCFGFRALGIPRSAGHSVEFADGHSALSKLGPQQTRLDLVFARKILS
ncbi:MAG: hypothetical protein F4109_03565 [Gammaproteobacteria bacterium]|nr:hypothetical protein [Gammaproteobacteria bacterium]MYD00995.1 hypothetical protein [Gammaproteobacteria bacterium]MYI24495.1 hypothetical protein [Gammaproteobacteria bacterium]